MNKKYLTLTALALFLSIGAGTASAHFGNQEGQAQKENFREEASEIFEKGTYQDWVDFQNKKMEDRIAFMQTRHQERMGEITNENFSQLAEAHTLMQNGEREKAQEIFQNMGIERGSFGGNGSSERGSHKGTGFRGMGSF